MKDDDCEVINCCVVSAQASLEYLKVFCFFVVIFLSFFMYKIDNKSKLIFTCDPAIYMYCK